MTQDSEDYARVKLNSPVKSVAIIGGGASGAIALDTLKSLDHFEEIVLYERRDVLGGVWNLDVNPNSLDIPPGVDQNVLDPPLVVPESIDGGKKTSRSNQERYVHTASYENLRTNIPEQLMTFSDEKSWGADESQYVDTEFVRGVAIQKYIERYVNRNKSHVVTRTTVEKIDKGYSAPNSKFKLVLRTELEEVDEEGNHLDLWTEKEFDSVIIATGHYHVPFIPEVPGIKDVYHNFPGVIKHSKTFRKNGDFKNQTVIVVGTRASGADITDISSKTARRVYQSKRSVAPTLRWRDLPNVELKAVITKYEVNIASKDFKVYFDDGTFVTNPDQIVYATGFRFSYPFLRDLYPNFTTGYILPDLYQHTFLIKDPKLAVIGVPTDAISFRAFEFQAVLVSRFLAGLITLPSLREQLDWALQRYADKGNVRAYHTIDLDNKFGYLQSLVNLGGGIEPLDSRKIGRPFPTFSEDDINKQNAVLERLTAFFDRAKIEEGISIPTA